MSWKFIYAKDLNCFQYNDCLLYFQRGVASEEPGTEEAKYRYHWGDALVRLGRKSGTGQMQNFRPMNENNHGYI